MITVTDRVHEVVYVTEHVHVAEMKRDWLGGCGTIEYWVDDKDALAHIHNHESAGFWVYKITCAAELG
jgi:hypothetical protein